MTSRRRKPTDGIRKRTPTHAHEPARETSERFWNMVERRAHERAKKFDVGEAAKIFAPRTADAEAEDMSVSETPRGLSFLGFFFSRLKEKCNAGGRPRLWGTVAAAVIIAAALGLIAASTAFSSLTVSVKPLVEVVAIKEVAVGLDTATAEILESRRSIPAELLEFSYEERKEFDATGKKFVEEKARGRARIYNRFSSQSQQLVQTTRFLSDSGVLYRLPRTITIPGAKIENGAIIPNFVEVELVADVAGEEGNQKGEVTLKIPGFKGTPKYEGFYAVSSAGFSGGIKGEARVVSEEDLKRAEFEVTKLVFDKARRDLIEKTPPDFTLLEALRTVEIAGLVSPKSGTPAERFTISSKAIGKALVFRKSDITELIKRVILSEDKSRLFLEGSAALTYRVSSVDYKKGTAEAVIDGEFKTRRAIDDKELKDLIKGATKESIVTLLKQQENISQFSLKFFPPWRSKAPSNPEKIRIVVEEPAIDKN